MPHRRMLSKKRECLEMTLSLEYPVLDCFIGGGGGDGITFYGGNATKTFSN